ncbi:MAG: hypothetical protein KatS3mg105_2050 [Gemmatales bacterium]|nr:MAG: hypothetical protein KatS3mg105_2050 [Gemmatales bacterium]
MFLRAMTISVLCCCLYANSLAAQAIRELKGHSGPVFALAFVADGRKLVSAGFDHRLNIWNVPHGKLLRTFADQPQRLVSVVAAKRWFASGTTNGMIQIHKDETNVVRLSAHDGCVHALAASHDGELLVSCGDDGQVKTWQPAQGEMIAHVSATPRTPLYAVAVSPNGKMIAAGGLDGQIRIYDRDSLTLLSTLRGHSGPIFALAFSPNSQVVVSGSQNGDVILWDVEPGTERLRLVGHVTPIYRVEFYDSGRRLLTAGKKGLVIIWDMEVAEPIFSRRFPGIVSAALSPDGRRLAVGTDKGACFLLDLPRYVR